MVCLGFVSFSTSEDVDLVWRVCFAVGEWSDILILTGLFCLFSTLCVVFVVLSTTKLASALVEMNC